MQSAGERITGTGARLRAWGILLAIGALVAMSTAVSLAAGPPDGKGPFFDESRKQQKRAEVGPEGEKYLIDVGSRLVAPGTEKPIRFQTGRARVYIQFERALTRPERVELIRAGVRFLGPLSGNTYLALLRPQAKHTLETHPLFRGMEEVLPEDRLTADIYHGTVSPHVVNPDGTWAVYVRFYEDVKLVHALKTVDRTGMQVADRSRFLFNERLLVSGTQEQIFALSNSNKVRSIEEIPPPPKDDNLVAAQLSNVDQVQAGPFNLDGDGVLVGQWESGRADVNHGDLSPRINVVQGGVGNSDHASHVAGTIMGTGAGNASALGMAPSVDTIFAYSSGGDTATEQANAVDNNSIIIANHSWGSTAGWNLSGGTWSDTGNDGRFGSYNGTARDYDDVVRSKGLLIIKSAGNDGSDCDPMDATDCDGFFGSDGQSYDTITTQGNAKNIITVGAIEDDGTTITNFSSCGPANDNRIKPDVVANGRGLFSCWSGNVTLNVTGCAGAAYCSISGTSMSSPVVTGTAALLVERYRDHYEGVTPSPDIIKGLLVNTAVDLGRPGPDYIFGHGLVDALASVNTIDVGDVRIVTDSVDEGDADEYLLEIPESVTDLRVTLNWIDPEGAANSGDPDLINDLDLKLIAPDASQFFPFSGPGIGNPAGNATANGPNTVDNVEVARLNNPQQGYWKVRVSGTEVPSGPQNYALVANASFNLPDQPDILVSGNFDFDEICSGEDQESVISIFNIGGEDLLVHSVDIVGGDPAFTLLPNPTQPFLVKPGSHVDVTLRYSPTMFGLQAGTLRIQSNDPDEESIDFALTGAGGEPDIDTLIADNGEFGTVCLESFKDLDLTINNSGSCDLTIDSIVSDHPEFDVAEVMSLPLVIGPGDSLAVPIRLDPDELGGKVGQIMIDSDDPDTPEQSVGVLGNTPPGIAEVTGSGEFGLVCAGEVAEKTVAICNLGQCNLNVDSASIDCPDFTIINNPFPGVVSPDFCVDVTVQFTPTSLGPKMCNLTFQTSDPFNPNPMIPLYAETPAPMIDVPPDLAFAPEVLQDVDACESPSAFPVSNTGLCPLEITNVEISSNEAEYSLDGLPSTPIFLDSGHIVGDGDLSVVFAPEVLDRHRFGEVSVTYVSDPILGIEDTVMRNLCGEGVRTGARVLVTHGGVPMDEVKSIRLNRLVGNRNQNRLDTVDNANNLSLQVEAANPPCGAFAYHREYGTVSNPVQLAPGSYQVTVMVRIDGRNRKKTVGFDVSSCDFNPTIVVDF